MILNKWLEKTQIILYEKKYKCFDLKAHWCSTSYDMCCSVNFVNQKLKLVRDFTNGILKLIFFKVNLTKLTLKEV